MRVVAAVCVLLVCSVFAPAAVLAEPVEHSGQLAATMSTPASQESDVDVATSTVQSANESNDASSSESSMGLQVSSFVQSTSAETSGVVENEMWEANVNRSGESASVTRRVGSLDRRVSTLREQRQELIEAHENGNVSTLQYQSRLAHLNGRLDALSAAASSTERAATRLNTDTPGLSKVKTEIERSKQTMPETARPTENPGRGNGSQANDQNPGQGDESQANDQNPGQGDESQANDQNPGQGDESQANDQNPGQGDESQANDQNPGQGNGSQANGQNPGQGNGSQANGQNPGNGSGPEGSEGDPEESEERAQSSNGDSEDKGESPDRSATTGESPGNSDRATDDTNGSDRDEGASGSDAADNDGDNVNSGNGDDDAESGNVDGESDANGNDDSNANDGGSNGSNGRANALMHL
ncbi:hypothetical protein SAMN04487948_10481 [Halogranum amylolyticum]|uniref:DUF7096 domain-containing protein n=1 Tax=Halogranum amylolyticum TaxID=660520 RepID=A0A1H8RKY5_9EURY|nr:hypothetical protein [Halogranum amylolyticum]SEO66927.1 hypothetical protein SAMN04487948_10481 [Halogranum amylolyticum]